jgi:predicted amidohydrolase YtcJ
MCQACNPSAAALFHEATRRSFIRTGASLASVLAVSAYADGARAQAGRQADTIFYNGPIHTMAASHDHRVEALAISNGRISAIGTKAAVFAQQTATTRMIDLGGHSLFPGFVDPHMHTSFVVMDGWVDLGPFTHKTIEEAMTTLKAAVAKAGPGQWVQAQKIDPSLMQGQPVTRQLLDAIAPDNPVFILESNGHVAYANSKALAIAGINRDMPDPPKGRFVRDANGDLTGRLEEGPAYGQAFAKMPMPSREETAQNLDKLLKLASSVGCTALHDCAIGSPNALELITSGVKDGAPVRAAAFLTSNLMDVWEKEGLKPGAGSDRFRLNGIKFWSDGSNQARTGYLREPYLNSDSRGDLNYSVDQLTAGIRRAHDLGWQVGVHANGDAAIDTTLAAYGNVLGASPRDDHRHRIEHCSILHSEQIARMAALKLSPSFLIGHVHYWGRAFRDRILGPERAKLYDPCASALKAGLRISLHSDYNVTPIDPLRCIDNAVNRVMQDGGEVLNPAERITPFQAVRAMTIDAAWQCRMDNITGSLEIGKYADLVVLDRDPLTIEPGAIRSTKVVETWLEGKRAYSA